jgi:hypothetical protein
VRDFYVRTFDDLERRDGLVATAKLASARDVEATTIQIDEKPLVPQALYRRAARKPE